MAARTIPSLPTWTAGMRVTGANLAAMVSYQQFWADPPMFRMYQTVTQNLTTATFTQITMDASDYDTDSGRGGSSPWSYTIPTGLSGRWYFKITVAFAGNATGVREAHLYKNAAQVRPEADPVQNAGTAIVTATTHATLTVVSGDVMAAYGYQASGGTLATYADSVIASRFEGRLISLANP